MPEITTDEYLQLRKAKEDKEYATMMADALEDRENIDEFFDHLHLEIGDVRNIFLKNPLLSEEWDDRSKIPDLLVELCRNPIYLHFLTKYILNIDLLPYQLVILQTCWTKTFPLIVATRGGAKSFLLAVYIICRMLLHQGCRVVVIGASLRQSMVIFNYIQQIYQNSPILQDISTDPPKRDVHMCFWNLGSSRAVFLPLGNGETIRGQRANITISDEFSSIPSEVFETVVRGFSSVKSDGISSNVSKQAKLKAMKHLGITNKTETQLEGESGIPTILGGNQLILSGTASYHFNHFYKYYKYYKTIILSGGNKEIIKAEFPDISLDEDMDVSKYAIIQLPYDMIPDGMMDSTIIGQAKATMDPSIFANEYGALFSADSEGFYLASVIQKATCPVSMENIPDPIDFPAKLKGCGDYRYVMGIDPASEDDNFTINIIEIHNGWRGLVYQFACNRKSFEQLKREDGTLKEEINDYNTFCAMHVRDLARRFNVEMIALDAAGGGISLRESLRDPAKLLDGLDELIYDMDDENTAGLKGKRILKMIEFSNSDWRRESHWGLRKDIHDKILLFPKYDPAVITVEAYKDAAVGKNFDTIEDCYLEIEQCKRETILIKHDKTATGQEKWDVPRAAGLDADQIRKIIKRDRFTSLLLANWAARLLTAEDAYRNIGNFGGVAKEFSNKTISGSPFIGPGAAKLKYLGDYNLTNPTSSTYRDGSGRRIFH